MATIPSISVRANNLYSNGFIEVYEGDEVSLLRQRLVISPDDNDKWHTVKHLDELTALAEKYYAGFIQDACKYWWIIADANDIYDPMDLTDYIGKDILIPDFLKVKLSLP